MRRAGRSNTSNMVHSWIVRLCTWPRFCHIHSALYPAQNIFTYTIIHHIKSECNGCESRPKNSTNLDRNSSGLYLWVGERTDRTDRGCNIKNQSEAGVEVEEEEGFW